MASQRSCGRRAFSRRMAPSRRWAGTTRTSKTDPLDRRDLQQRPIGSCGIEGEEERHGEPHAALHAQYGVLMMETGSEAHEHAAPGLHRDIERGEVELAALVVIVEIDDPREIAIGHLV